MRRNVLRALAGACAAAVLPVSSWAQVFPAKPVRIIVPATPGGSSDIFARALAQRMQASIGQPVIVEYKPGAATNIGTDFVAKAPADGYTLLINGITLSTNPLLYNNLTYNPATDFAPVIEVAQIPNVIAVHPSLAVNNLKDLVQMLKSQPGKFAHGTPGAGSSGHLSGELFAARTGTQITHVAYQGNAQATTDLLGGTLQLGFVNLPVGMPFFKAGRLKPLAVTSLKRSPQLPDVPTVAEALGIADFELTGWFGIVAPVRTPPEVVARLNSEFAKALQDAGVRETITGAGAEIVGGSAEQFGTRMKREAERLAPLIKQASTGG